jgi:Family of unknown function (DUF6527)
MATLRQLEGQFIAYRQETGEEMFVRGVDKPADLFRRVETLAEAHGVRFICPKSFATHGGVAGAHTTQVFFEGSPVPSQIGVNKNGKTVRWHVSGTSLDDLTLSPSIQEEDGVCQWHGFVRNGDVA